MSQAEWLRELEAERVTGSRESFTDLMARLEMERPEAPPQVAARQQMERHAKARLFAEQAKARWDAGETSRFTHLEKRLGRARLDELMDELTKSWWAA